MKLNFNSIVKSMAIAVAAASLGVASVAQSQDVILSGGNDDYLRFCASCHGIDGKGKGPVSGALKKTPSDLTMLSKANDGKFPYKRVRMIVEGSNDASVALRSHGPAEMPVWGNVIYKESGSYAASKARILNIIDHLQSIQQ